MASPTTSFLLQPANLIIMVLYFSGLLYAGFYFSRKTRTSQGFFIGNKDIPSWALGLSMISAKISSVTFLAMPAAAFALDWRQFVPNLSIPIVAGLAIWLLVPFFRTATKTSAFEYLNARFGRGARLYGAIMFLLAQAVRLGAVIYLMSIPLHMLTGLPMMWTILAAGTFCTIYTIMGGIEAVIWTDVAQSIILYLGAIAALGVILYGIPGGLAEIFRVAGEHEKFGLGPMTWSLDERTFWTMLIVGIMGWIGIYTSDQVLIQRYLAAKTMSEARMAGWLSAILCLPTWGFFFFIGTSLYVFYQVVPDPAVARLPADDIFPHFILTQMPAGLNGLVIAGILSAAMGSLSAALSAFSTVATSDIVRPYLLKNRSDAFYKGTARWLTGLAALIMFGMGFLFAFTPKESFIDYSQQLLSLIGGVVPAFFVLGFFAPKVNNRILWCGFWASLALNIYLILVYFQLIPVWNPLKMHPYWVSTVVMTFMITLSVLLGLCRKKPAPNTEGLTVFSTPKITEP